MNIMIVIFPDVEELDFVGPYEVFSYLKKLGREVSVYTVSQGGGPIRCANGLRVLPDYSFATAPQADWVVIPGGQGRRVEMTNRGMLEFVREAAERAQIVASVCTGAFILAMAGLLRGGRATTYHLALDELQTLMPDLTVTGERIEQQGNIYMAAGVCSGIDLAIQLCDLLEPGLGHRVAEKIEYSVTHKNVTGGRSFCDRGTVLLTHFRLLIKIIEDHANATVTLKHKRKRSYKKRSVCKLRLT